MKSHAKYYLTILICLCKRLQALQEQVFRKKSFQPVIFVLLFLLPISVIGQCPGTSCTYNITGVDSGTYSINSGEKICFDAGADFTGTINLIDGEFINCASAPQSFVLFTNSSSNAIINNYGTLDFTSGLTIDGSVTVNNYDLITINGSLSLSLGVKFNNYNTTSTTTLILRDNFTNNGTLTVSSSLTSISSGFLINTGDITMNEWTSNGSWTNYGTITSSGSCTYSGTSIGTISGGCITCDDWENGGTITGTTCGNIFVASSTLLSSVGSLLGDIALIDATPPGSAPFIDTNNGTVGPNIVWSSCTSCASAPVEEICGNGIDDSGDGRIDEVYPGGVQTNLQLWLDGEEGTNTTTTGSDITSWGDRSTNSYSADSDVNATDYPVYTPNTINYHPGIVFDGTHTDVYSDGLHLGSDYIYSDKGGMQIFSVVKHEPTGNSFANIYDFGHGNSEVIGLNWTHIYSVNQTPTSHGGENPSFFHHTGSLPVLVGFEIDFETDQTLLKNGTPLQTTAIPGLSQITANEIAEDNVFGSVTAGPVTIGRQSSSASLSQNRIFNGAISEILVYNDTLSQSNQEKVNSYLGLKYGLTLGHNYYLSDGTIIKDITDGYANNIAGIALDSCGALIQKQSESVIDSSIISIALTSFATANSTNLSTFISDKSALIWGHNGAAENSSWNGTNYDIPNEEYLGIDRVWKFNETQDVQNVVLRVDVNDSEFDLPALSPLPGSDGVYHLLIDDDGDFTNGGTTAQPMTFVSGSEWEATIVDPANSYFSIATKIPEICNDGIDNDGDGDIDCLDADCGSTTYYAAAQTSTSVITPDNILGAPDGQFAAYGTASEMILDLGSTLDIGEDYVLTLSYTFGTSDVIIEESIDGVNFFAATNSPYTIAVATLTDVTFTSSVHTRYLRITAPFGHAYRIDAVTYENCLCQPATNLVGEYLINSNPDVQGNIVSINQGDSLTLDFVGSYHIGSFVWTGPDSLYQVNDSGAFRDYLILNNIQPNQSGEYVAFYFDPQGCTDSSSFTVTVIPLPEICNNGIDDDGDGDIDCADGDCNTTYYGAAQTNTGTVINPDNVIGIPDGLSATVGGTSSSITIDLGSALDIGEDYTLTLMYALLSGDVIIEESIDGVNFFSATASPFTLPSGSLTNETFTTTAHTRYIRISTIGTAVLIDAVTYDNCLCTPATSMVEEYQINSGTYITGSNVIVTPGDFLRLEFIGNSIIGNSFDGWTFIWTGPNSYYQVTDSGDNRDRIELSNIQPNQAGEYKVVYFDDVGCIDSTSFTVNVVVLEICDNGIDDDGDGLIDCDDPDCGVSVIDYENGQLAYQVVGQPDLTSNSSGLSETTFDDPQGIAIDEATGKVFVADTDNHRILRFASISEFLNGNPAEVVIGQSDFISNTAGLAQNKLDEPSSIQIDQSGNLWVADKLNHRILRFDNASTLANFPNADGVLGQADFTTNTTGLTSSTMNSPISLFVEMDGTLWVSDGTNSRALRFDAAASKANGAAADGVLGQADFTSTVAGGTISTTYPVSGMVVINGSLYLGTSQGNRVLIWEDAKNKTNGADADRVLGQTDFTSTSYTIGTNSISSPNRLSTDMDGNLYVSDMGQPRVLVFMDANSKANGADGDYVLGQPDFGSTGYVTSASQNRSVGEVVVLTEGNKTYLALSDFASNRIVILTENYETDELTSFSNTLNGIDLSGNDSLIFKIISQPTVGIVVLTDSISGGFTFNAPGACPLNGDSLVSFLYTLENGNACLDTAEVFVRITEIAGCEICNNGIDDDGDGDIDCADGDCPSFDVDGDLICDYTDLDNDNDGIPDVEEGCGVTTDIGGTIGLINSVTNTSYNLSGTSVSYFRSGANQAEVFGHNGLGQGPVIRFTTTSVGSFNGSLSTTFSNPVGSVSFKLIGFDDLEDFTVNVYDENNVLYDLTVEGIISVGSLINQTGNQFVALTSTATGGTDVIPSEPSQDYLGSVLFYFPGKVSRIDITYIQTEISNVRFTQPTFCTEDTDGDGVFNNLDLDSDNDGIFDSDEAGHLQADENGDGVIDGIPSDFGTNGLYNLVETVADNGILNYNISDSEEAPDGIYDAYEVDADGDTCFDTLETSIDDEDEDGVAGTGIPTVDVNGLVSSITYGHPFNEDWQDPLINACDSCEAQAPVLSKN